MGRVFVVNKRQTMLTSRLALYLQSSSIQSLTALQPGDHIVVNANRWDSAETETYEDWYSPSSFVGSSHHMLLVEVIDEENIHVIHMTARGIKEENLRVNSECVRILSYECRSSGEEAIEHARRYLSFVYDSDDIEFVTDAKGRVSKDPTRDVGECAFQGFITGGLAGTYLMGGVGMGTVIGGFVGGLAGAVKAGWRGHTENQEEH